MIVIHSNIATGIRVARLACHIAQNGFSPVTDGSYIRELELGTKKPTLAKIDQLAAVMKLHPLTVLTLSYCQTPTVHEAAAMCAYVISEIDRLRLGAAQSPGSFDSPPRS